MTDAAAHARAYAALRIALASGHYRPGQKVTLRATAEALGMSMMPVRDAMRRLAAEGALENTDRRSARIPPADPLRLLELRDIRMPLEGLAAHRAAERADPELVASLEAASLGIRAARERGDIAADVRGIHHFHFTLYRASGMPILVQTIEALWLRTGPYMPLLFPDYAGRRAAGEGRAAIVAAVARRDAPGARALIEADIAAALNWMSAKLAAGSEAPATPVG